MPLNDSLRSLIFRSLRLGFRITPMPASLRDRMRQRFLDRHGDLVPGGPVGKPANTSSIRAFDHTAHRFLGFVTRREETLPSVMPATIVAFYLPQFHPIPENDAWWGKGFTEWRNVGRALPQFEGQVQPRLPGDLGYYDLRLPEILREQMTLAREYGVGAFCTYFYWFAGKTLLEQPLRQWLEDPSLDLPICLCWANENWSRRWDGRADDVLVAQAHSAEDDLAFIEHVSSYLRDPRYLRVDGKPILLVYRPGLLPEPRATATRWREWCRSHDVGEIHIAYVQSFDNVHPASIGFDAAVAFPPNNVSLEPITSEFRLINPAFAGQIYDWRELASTAMRAEDPPYRLYPAVNPGWDNEARRSGRGRSFVRATPGTFADWTRASIVMARRRAPEAPLVFVNAWNEWAEGAILEPDAHYGFAWLHALRRALLPVAPKKVRPCAVIDVQRTAGLENIIAALLATGLGFRTLLLVADEHLDAVVTMMSRSSLEAEIVVAHSRGKGMAPLLRLAGRLVDEGEDVVLMLCGTPSSDRSDSMPDVEQAVADARAIMLKFTQDEALGLVIPNADLRSALQRVSASSAHFDYLCALLGVAQRRTQQDVPMVGNVFRCRLRALAPLLDAPLAEADFVSDAGHPIGDMSQAIEHLIALTALQGGFHMSTPGEIRASN